MSNAFQKVLEKEHADDSKLGMPATSYEHDVRRRTLMEKLAGGKGWGKPKKEPERDAQGLTRGDRKRALREATNAKVSEARPHIYMHGAARRRALAAEVRAAA